MMMESLDEVATQAGFADLVGVSQQAISNHVARYNLTPGATYRQWLFEYTSRLRDEAAGRGGEDNQSLTRARTAEAEASANLKQLMILEKTGVLVPVAEIEPRLNAMITAARTELLSLPDKLAAKIKALHGVDVDVSLIEEDIHASLNHLAEGLHADSADDDAPGEEGLGAAA